MKQNRHGIAAAGNWILDITKMIDVYPDQDTLANISDQSSNNGGAPYNVLKDLSRLKAPFPLYGLGLVGQDEPGEHILSDCRSHGIDTSQLHMTAKAGTSYTDVMLVRKTGRRTFFHYRGANALLDLHHVDLKALNSRIFHLGYLLLLDKLDGIEENDRTPASLLLQGAKNEGFLTSVDLVSEKSERFIKIILPSLPYTDILFCNEYEAGKLCAMQLNGEKPDLDSMRQAIDKLLEYGVSQWAIIHFPAGCVAGSPQGDFIIQGSVKLPVENIIGTTGAGDAFAAGTLYGIHERWTMQDCLKAGVCCAASSLRHASCSDGVISMKDSLISGSELGFRILQVAP